ncbi:SurA N-terminal domain-containing protein [Aliikangiella maris]|uniref:Periplasmic chaperone PpiD n=2 Tax=Aliikangiella maris TaxID=3162458 RepID=A0ABV3MMQ9_9GAMM
MLESIREGVQKPWVKIVIFAIVISFVFAGYFTSSFFLGDPNAVAVVNGESISRLDFQRIYANVKAQQADYYKANVKTEEDERKFQENVLERLITYKVREQATRELGMRLSDDALRNVIQSDPNYQLDGKYSSTLVEQTLIRSQISKEEFKNDYETREVAQQLLTGVLDSEFVLPSEVAADYQFMAQKRSGKALQVNSAPFKQQIELTDDDINQYYQDNQETFRQEEKISVEYIELNSADLASQVELSEEAIQEFYDNNLDRYKSDEQRQISHILITTDERSDAEALEKIQSLKKRIDSGETFEDIAKTESDDEPTRETGGDLGVLIAGSLDAALEKAATELAAVGDVSEPIKSEFGYHLIKLSDLTPGSALPLEQVKDELMAELKKTKAEEVYYNKLDTLTNKVFEISDSLNEASIAVGLEVKNSPLFGRSSREGIFANQEVQDAAFSVSVKDSLLNSEPIQISDSHVIVLRRKDYQPSKIQPLEEVKARVTNTLKQEKAKKAAEELASSIIAKLEANESIDALLAEKKLSWTELKALERNNASLSFLSNQHFFKMPKPEEGKVTVDLVEDFQGYTILMLNSIEEGDWEKADETTKKQRGLYLSSYFSSADFTAFIEDFRANSEISKNLNNLIQ